MLDYSLLDSGNRRKLERFGEIVLDRPEPKALWSPMMSADLWQKADARFEETGKTEGRWARRNDVPDEWLIRFQQLQFGLRLTPFKHVGIFPEQAGQWSMLMDSIANARRPIKVLNLFAYTGAATVVCAAAGASVTHVEASRSTLTWARHNAELSGLAAAPIRWIPEDVPTFLRRLLKRGETYDGIILDPPLTGVGPSRQRWQFRKNIDEVLQLCRSVLSDDPLFFLLNDYAVEEAPVVWENRLKKLAFPNGRFSSGKLVLEAESGSPHLETGTWIRWDSVL